MSRISNLRLPALLGLLALALPFAGCGGGGGGNDGNAGPTPVAYRSGSVFVTTISTGFDAASYSLLDPVALTADLDLPSNDGIIANDNAAVAYGGKVYILNKYDPVNSDNITILDPNDLSSALGQFSVKQAGEGSVNLQDLVFVSATKAYVSRLASDELLVVDPTATGHEIQGTINLSALAAAGDTDGVEPGPMVLVGNRLFVALQGLNQSNFFSPEFEAALAVIDTDTDTVLGRIPLTRKNPGYLHYDAASGKIFVSEVGAFGSEDGGVETVDPVALQAEGILVSEADVGGDLGDVALADGKGYLVFGGFAANDVAVFDPTTGQLSGTLGVSSPYIPNLAVDGAGHLFVPDRTASKPGVRVFDSTDDTELTTDPIDVGLPPNVVVVLP